MRKILLFLLSLMVSCNGIPNQTIVQRTAIHWRVGYFKDTTTNICFGAVFNKDAQPIVIDQKAFTCVPCDSLKNVRVFSIGN
jgi:hypothetical protein